MTVTLFFGYELCVVRIVNVFKLWEDYFTAGVHVPISGKGKFLLEANLKSSGWKLTKPMMILVEVYMYTAKRILFDKGAKQLELH